MRDYLWGGIVVLAVAGCSTTPASTAPDNAGLTRGATGYSQAPLHLVELGDENKLASFKTVLRNAQCSFRDPNPRLSVLTGSVHLPMRVSRELNKPDDVTVTLARSPGLTARGRELVSNDEPVSAAVAYVAARELPAFYVDHVMSYYSGMTNTGIRSLSTQDPFPGPQARSGTVLLNVLEARNRIALAVEQQIATYEEGCPNRAL